MRRLAVRAVPYSAVTCAAFAWGTWPLVIRHAESMGPLPAALESTIVMAVITVVAALTSLVDRVPRRATWSGWAWIACLGVGDALNVLLFFAAYKLTIAIAVLSHYMAPILVALAAPVVLREKMTARTASAIALSFGGLAVMLARSGSPADGSAAWASAALGAGSAVFYALNVIVNKFVVDSFSTSEAMFWHGLVATPMSAAFVPHDAWKTVDPHAASFLALVAIVPGALAGLAFVWGLRRMPAAHASTLSLLEPLVAVLFGAAFLGETLGLRAGLGGALILAGAVVVMTQPSGARPATLRRDDVGVKPSS